MTNDQLDADGIDRTISTELFPYVTLSADRIVAYLNAAEPLEEAQKRLAAPIYLTDKLVVPPPALDIAKNWRTAPVEQRPSLLTQLWRVLDDESAPTVELYLRRALIYKLTKELTTLYYRSRKYRNVLANNVKKPTNAHHRSSGARGDDAI